MIRAHGAWIALALGAGLLGACSTTTTAVGFRKAGADAADQRRDESACLHEATGLDNRGLILIPFEIESRRLSALHGKPRLRGGAA